MDTRILLLLVLCVCVVSGGKKKKHGGKKTDDDEQGLTKQILCIVKPKLDFCQDKPKSKVSPAKQIACLLRPSLYVCDKIKGKKNPKNEKVNKDGSRMGGTDD